MGGTCSQNNQDKVFTRSKDPLRSLKVPHILLAACGFPHALLLEGLSPSLPLLSCPLQTPWAFVWSAFFYQIPDLSVSVSLWPFMNPEPLYTYFSFQKVG